MIADESIRRLQAAVASLPANLREPLVLTALEGMSQKEAAEILHTNVKAIENRVARARAKLATLLDADQVQDVSDVREEGGG
jgi:RNA polymerase sigma-70 factor (ECF subfamily)